MEKYYNTIDLKTALIIWPIFLIMIIMLYDRFAEYWDEQGYNKLSHSQIRLYEILLEFGLGLEGVDNALFKDLIKLDYVSQQKPSRYPKGIEVQLSQEEKKAIRNFFNSSENITQYLPHLAKYTPSQISRMAHIELFDYDVTQGLDTDEIRKAPTAVLFDYKYQINCLIKIRYKIRFSLIRESFTYFWIENVLGYSILNL